MHAPPSPLDRLARLLAVLATLPLLGPALVAQDEPAAPASDPVGVVVTSEGLAPGYVLFSPLSSGDTYLVDRDGLVVHRWTTTRSPGASVYLLDDGSLLRPAREHSLPRFGGGGQGGRVQRFAWDGALIWEYALADERMLQHHDVEWKPDGNVLMIAWEGKTREEALYAGRRPDRIAEQGIWPDVVLEVRPTPPSGGEIVWEWRAWDHLVQDTDPRFQDFGDPSAPGNIGRIDINGDAEPEPYTDEELQQLRAMGYVGGNTRDEPPDPRADWLHTNSIDYHPGLDRIILSTPRFHEIWIIDHSTTTAEARGRTGGRAGRGGDLLWRWGNPRTHDRGTVADQQLFGQHDAQWIPEGLPGAGRVLVFDNGSKRPEGKYSRVLELPHEPDEDGGYPLPAAGAHGPARAAWEYVAPTPTDFYSAFISGAHRMANGNTFICAGSTGRVFEVTPDGEIVWEYRSPFVGDIRTDDGALPQPGLDRFPRAVFRATFIPADHAGLAGRELRPLDPQPDPGRPAEPAGDTGDTGDGADG